MPLSSGTRLGTYEILGPLGAGGMVEVHRARDTRLGRDVAIKALPEAFALDREFVTRFLREGRALASLNHPNISAIYGLEESGDRSYLVLEFVEGRTLPERLRRGPLPVAEAIRVCRQIAAGLEAAHESGIVHRDLKPGNVMLTRADEVKVLDFGLAKDLGATRDTALTAEATLSGTTEGTVLGTPAYMSPEQASGGATDRRTDIWAFRSVLYECLVGRPVFAGESYAEIVAQVLHAEPDWAALPAATPTRVRELLERCLTRDPTQRLRDIGEARIALQDAAPGEVAGDRGASRSAAAGAAAHACGPGAPGFAGALRLGLAGARFRAGRANAGLFRDRSFRDSTHLRPPAGRWRGSRGSGQRERRGTVLLPGWGVGRLCGERRRQVQDPERTAQVLVEHRPHAGRVRGPAAWCATAASKKRVSCASMPRAASPRGLSRAISMGAASACRPTRAASADCDWR